MQIIVEEVLKGTPVDPMILMRPDVEFFEDIDIAPLSTGERIVLFTILSPNPEKFTNKYKAFYDSRGDNSVFDIDEMDREFPRTPHMFAQFPKDSWPPAPSVRVQAGFEVDGIDPAPYFELEKLKLTIRDRLAN